MCGNMESYILEDGRMFFDPVALFDECLDNLADKATPWRKFLSLLPASIIPFYKDDPFVYERFITEILRVSKKRMKECRCNAGRQLKNALKRFEELKQKFNDFKAVALNGEWDGKITKIEEHENYILINPREERLVVVDAIIFKEEPNYLPPELPRLRKWLMEC